MEKEEEIKNRIQKDLQERNAEDGSLRANLSSPGNDKKLDLEKINFLNKLVSTYKKDIANPEEARWLEHAKINQSEQIKKVYNTPMKKLGRAFAKAFPKSVTAALWSKITKPIGEFRDKVKSSAAALWSKATKPIGEFRDKVKSTASAMWSKATKPFVDLKDKVKNSAAALWSKTTKPLVDLKDKAKESVKKGFKNLTSKASEMLGKITKPLTALKDAIINQAGKAKDPIMDNILKILAFLNKQLSDGMEGRPGIFNNQKNGQPLGSETLYIGKYMGTIDHTRAPKVNTFQPDQLRDFLKEKQFSSVIPALNEAIANGDKDFQLKTKKIIGDKVVGYNLNFSKNDNGTIKFNSFEVGVKNEDNPGTYKTVKVPVNGMNTPSSSEAYKLLSGETICRQVETSPGVKENRLYNLNEQDMKNNPHDVRLNEFVADRHHINNVVNSLPHPPGTTEDYKKQLVDDLCVGKKRAVPLQENGLKTTVNVQVGEKPGLMKYSDVNNKPVKYSDVRASLNPPKKVVEKVGQKAENKKPIKRMPARHKSKAA
ncbi:hypothetical protein DBR11_11385 [Pedobacter sp. HMWF019]|uniref:hypothetical protein n=1 Tax=Pedobacter sp. HMWF019 TaxID=2056856 RepID=UPI000D341149|nr:hypothetical protein [Pedobacter sp. HMWF019]PTS99870.1 hypothetical protein DBR11_11385 [Pedobacter sp. HMWF019]